MSFGMIAPPPHRANASHSSPAEPGPNSRVRLVAGWKAILRFGSGPYLSAMLLLALTAVVWALEVPAEGPLETGDLPPPSRASLTTSAA